LLKTIESGFDNNNRKWDMKTLARQSNAKETLAHTSTAVFTNTNFAFALSHGPVRDIRRAPRMILHAYEVRSDEDHRGDRI